MTQDNSAPGEAYDQAVPTPTLSEVAYGPHERHVLDLWQAPAEGLAPLAFVIHGGGWTSGSKERVQRFVDVPALLAAGVSVVAINYRYTTQADEADIEPPVLAPLGDAARALQFVRTQAAAWGLASERIGAAGGSAGACSSLWLAFHADLADPASADPVARESTRLACVAVRGAQTTLDPQQMQDWTPNSRYGGHAFGKQSFAEFLADREAILPWIQEYSPYSLLRAGAPPVYLTYAKPPALGEEQEDPTHTSNFGVKLQERCRELGVACDLVFPGAPAVEYETSTAFLIAHLTEGHSCATGGD